jgi:hypothetical protein
MAERVRRTRRALLLAVVVLGAPGACNGDNCEEGICVEESSARLLDEACRAGKAVPCNVSGDAEETTGITEDSIGFRLGDKGGTLTIPLAALDTDVLVSGIFDVQVLVAASIEGASSELSATLSWGSCVDCPPDPSPFIGQISYDYTWVTVVAGQPSVAGVSSTIAPDAALTLTGANIDVADLRSVVTSPQFGCTVAGGAGARVLRR